jgi:bifunctional UDP-N-acetylglucosamine pyrophosphorylase/glucosamine-1-phosphate N-acetyltransferase
MEKGNKTRIIVLAAGKGTRMKSELPKVLAKVKGKSMIKHLLESVEKSNVDRHPVVVVGYKKELVMEELGDKYHYVNQEEQLGTGHAVGLAGDYLKDKAENVLILFGDQPFTSAAMIKKIFDTHLNSGRKITMATFRVPDFEDWKMVFYNFSRIIRDKNGKIIRDVQFKDTSDEEKKIKELNPSYYCFDADWLWSNLENLKNDNAQKEYYITDLIRIATENGIEIETVDIDPREALGANSKEELEILEKL